jgi:hypothetical protein
MTTLAIQVAGEQQMGMPGMPVLDLQEMNHHHDFLTS